MDGGARGEAPGGLRPRERHRGFCKGAQDPLVSGPSSIARALKRVHDNDCRGREQDGGPADIGFTVQLLADHPARRQEIVNHRSLIPAAIEEVLRFEAPSPVQCRYASRAPEHHGQTVPKNSIVLLLNGSANRDERRFENPDRFDIHRKGEGHMSFGYSLHFCLGAALARLEARVALDEMLKRCRFAPRSSKKGARS